MNGKGSKRRPMKVSQKEFEENWERVFDLKSLCFPKQKKVVVNHSAKSRMDYQKALWDCWKEVRSLIKEGNLQGDGFDETAERNGIIKAANYIACMIDRYREAKPKEKKDAI